MRGGAIGVGAVSRALDARLGRLVERLAGAGRLGLPAGPVEGWPGAGLRRLERMVNAGGALQRAAWARLTDADLQWVSAFWLGDDESEEVVGSGVDPGG